MQVIIREARAPAALPARLAPLGRLVACLLLPGMYWTLMLPMIQVARQSSGPAQCWYGFTGLALTLVAVHVLSGYSRRIRENMLGREYWLPMTGAGPWLGGALDSYFVLLLMAAGPGFTPLSGELRRLLAGPLAGVDMDTGVVIIMLAILTHQWMIVLLGFLSRPRLQTGRTLAAFSLALPLPVMMWTLQQTPPNLVGASVAGTILVAIAAAFCNLLTPPAPQDTLSGRL